MVMMYQEATGRVLGEEEPCQSEREGEGRQRVSCVVMLCPLSYVVKGRIALLLLGKLCKNTLSKKKTFLKC